MPDSGSREVVLGWYKGDKTPIWPSIMNIRNSISNSEKHQYIPNVKDDLEGDAKWNQRVL